MIYFETFSVPTADTLFLLILSILGRTQRFQLSEWTLLCESHVMPCKAAVVTEGNEIYIPISQAQDLCREIGEPSEISKVYLKINGKNNLENAKKILSGI